MKKLETRVFRGMELRLDDSDPEKPKLSGHIAVFNQLSEDFGGWREKIAPGAFAETIKRDDIRALWNHETGLVLGRLSAGTLSLREDEEGLAFENEPPDTAWFKDRAISVRRKDVTGASFGFFTDDDHWEEQKDGTFLRTLLKVSLVEVSPGVTFPAYPQTEVGLRSLEAFRKNTAGQPPAGSGSFHFRERELELLSSR